ncbi:MAG: cytochrome-c peroxidase [Gammaproteobacteria bacterium]|nr:cytochrome-c peroxidase [Gammaproteobacteria bacterium]
MRTQMHWIQTTLRVTVASAVLLLSPVHSVADSDEGDDHELGRLPAPARDSDFQQPSAALFELGQALFFDKELSGNRNISCATCHSPVVATVDGLSINTGTGAQGLSVLRDAGTGVIPPLIDPPLVFPPPPPGPSGFNDPLSRGSRNMTPLFNLGHVQFEKLFWDGRIEVDQSVPQGFATPAGSDLPFGFNNVLAALSVFAETDHQEMLGDPSTNELAHAAVTVHPQIGVWDGLVARIKLIPEYVNLFINAFPGEVSGPDDIEIVHFGNAIGAFQAAAFRSDNSRFDRFLRGDRKAMSNREKRGMRLFYGRAECSTCHSGVFQTDHDFHAIGMPQVGPGFEGAPTHEDFGREGFTRDPADRYRFRTPNLRNVVLTGPWGHNGAFNSLRAVIEHHLDPVDSLMGYDRTQVVLPSRADLDALDFIALDNPAISEGITDAIEINPMALSDDDVEHLIYFLDALTDPSASDLRKTVPKRVPSGLPLAEIRRP